MNGREREEWLLELFDGTRDGARDPLHLDADAERAAARTRRLARALRDLAERTDDGGTELDVEALVDAVATRIAVGQERAPRRRVAAIVALAAGLCAAVLLALDAGAFDPRERRAPVHTEQGAVAESSAAPADGVELEPAPEGRGATGATVRDGASGRAGFELTASATPRDPLRLAAVQRAAAEELAAAGPAPATGAATWAGGLTRAITRRAAGVATVQELVAHVGATTHDEGELSAALAWLVVTDDPRAPTLLDAALDGGLASELPPVAQRRVAAAVLAGHERPAVLARLVAQGRLDAREAEPLAARASADGVFASALGALASQAGDGELVRELVQRVPELVAHLLDVDDAARVSDEVVAALRGDARAEALLAERLAAARTSRERRVALGLCARLGVPGVLADVERAARGGDAQALSALLELPERAALRVWLDLVAGLPPLRRVAALASGVAARGADLADVVQGLAPGDSRIEPLVDALLALDTSHGVPLLLALAGRRDVEVLARVRCLDALVLHGLPCDAAPLAACLGDEVESLALEEAVLVALHELCGAPVALDHARARYGSDEPARLLADGFDPQARRAASVRARVRLAIERHLALLGGA